MILRSSGLLSIMYNTTKDYLLLGDACVVRNFPYNIYYCLFCVGMIYWLAECLNAITLI